MIALMGWPLLSEQRHSKGGHAELAWRTVPGEEALSQEASGWRLWGSLPGLASPDLQHEKLRSIFTDHSWIRCTVGLSFISWLFWGFPALGREVGLCSCGMHMLPSIPLVVVTVGVPLCWKSPHSRAVKLYKCPFINDSLACVCTLVQSGVSWACQWSRLWSYSGPSLPREPLCDERVPICAHISEDLEDQLF